MTKKLTKRERRERRKKRTRAKIFGTLERPRLSVFRSNKHIYAQLIDDENGKVLTSANSLKIKKEDLKGIKLSRKVAIAFLVGKLLAEKAKKLGIEKAVFDRSGYKYHGRVKALREGAIAGGLKI